MNRLVALLVLVLGVCAVPAQAAMVYDGYATGPGGLSTPYPAVNPQVYAGLIEMNYNGVPILEMSDDRNTLSHVGEYWPATLYTYADVQAGAPVRFSPAQYARAASILGGTYPMGGYDPSFSLRQLAESAGNPWLASVNTKIWDITSSASCPAYWSDCSTDDNIDWSSFMVIASGGLGRDEFLIPLIGQNITIASIPIPSAAWLLGSGLVGLIGVTRKRHKAPH